MSDAIKNYMRYVTFEKNAVVALPHWASCPTLSYMNALFKANEPYLIR